MRAQPAVDPVQITIPAKSAADLWSHCVEVKVAQGGPVCVESEVYLPGDNKFQVETKGSKADSMKLTHTEGKNQIKLKYILSTKAPVLGFDTFVGTPPLLHQEASFL